MESLAREAFRADRLALRLLVAAGAVGSAASAAPGVTGARLWMGWVAIATFSVVHIAVLEGPGLPPVWRHDRRSSLVGLVVLAAAAVGALLSFDVHPALIWLPLVVVVQAARSLPPWPAVAVAAGPSLAVVAASWQDGQSLQSAGLNLVIAGLVFAFMVLRRRQRDLDDLAAAQREVIERERARAASADLQREIGARLHDVLAHTLSGLVVSLTTASLQARAESASPELRDRLDAATELARSGLVEARQAVESLRPRTEPTPGLPGGRPTAEGLTAWFEVAADRLSRSAGARVRLTGDLGLVPPDQADLARSVLMESLTNSLRHSPACTVEVSADPVALSVVSRREREPAGGPESGPHPSGRHGLAGLRRRVEAAGGRLHAGPTEQGWTLRWEFAT